MRFLKPLAITLALCVLFSSAVAQSNDADDKPKDPFKGLEFRSIGPGFMSGRIADVVVHPSDQSTWYVGVGSGHVWKTTNAATTWKPIFENEGSYSIGCVTLDPSQPEIVWVGTGENVGGRHVGFGDGVYKSMDGGETWKNMGLEKSEHIGTIVVDPRNSNVVYVASQGPLWSSGGERGLYKTTDGGETWKKVLGGGEYTGVNEVRVDPRNPDVLYATTHQRYRNVAALVNGGPESGIHKSFDGGETWHELTNGLPKEDMGKIGLAISPHNPDVVYAAIELAHRKGGFYRSTNGGGSWEKRSDHVAGGTGPHYYQEIYASPHQFDRVYFMEVRLHVTEDGGKTFTNIEGKFKHVDNHALAFNPNDPDYLLAGCDGGLYESWDLGKTWKFISNLPVTQYYKVAVDYDEPFYNLVGGTQDNNTQSGPSRTDNLHGIRNSDWFITLGGDGHQPAMDPTNPNIIYSEWQQGNLVRHDKKTGEIVYIQPQPGKDEPGERFNWDAPILISPHDPGTLYYASQRVWRSDDRGDSWRPISGDLTRNQDRLKLPMMGRVQSFDSVWDIYAMSKYNTITSLAQSPIDENVIYAGTDDGFIQVTEDGGETWRKNDRLPGVPESFFVNDLKADLYDANIVYACVDNHKSGDFAPYVLKSTNRGRAWQSMTANLPDRHIVWRLVQDHLEPQLMFIGTEFGVFFTVNGGDHWNKLSGGAPNIPFRDLVIQKRESDLVGATFGRGFYILDDYSPLRQVSNAMLAQNAELFPVRKAWWYVERRTLGGREKGSQGSAFYTAPNPPFGAVFTYYLHDEVKTRKQARRDREKEIEKTGGDTPWPGFEEVRKEAIEEKPGVVLTVRDQNGDVVRRITGPAKAGFQRVAWDLRYPSVEPWKPNVGDDDENRGVLAAPGTYSVSLAVRQDGVLNDFGKTQTFEVVPLRRGTLPGESPQAVVAFLKEMAEMDRATLGADAAIDETMKRLQGIKDALMRSTVNNVSLDDDARAIEKRLGDLKIWLAGDPQRRVFNTPGPVSIRQRLRVVQIGNRSSTYGPTPTHRMSFEIAESEFAELRRDLEQLMSVELPALERKLDAAGVPWTPGRGVPAER